MARSTSRRRVGLSRSSRLSRLIRLCRESRRVWSTEMGVKAGHKPGSVHTSREGGRLSIWDRRFRRPRAARSGGTGPMASPRSLALLPAGVYRASTSRCCWCALTAPLHPCLCLGEVPTGPSAVCFCGTLLTVTRTGRYPASLAIREPGLSSADTQRDRPQPPRLLSAFIMPRGHNRGRSGAVAQPDRATVS